MWFEHECYVNRSLGLKEIWVQKYFDPKNLSKILPSLATAPAPAEAEIALYPADPATHPLTHPSGIVYLET